MARNQQTYGFNTFCNNKPTAIDISITSPTQKALLKDGPKDCFAAVKKMEKQKLKKYGPIIQKGNIEFLPLILEAYGGIPPQAMRFLKRLASDLRDRTRKPESVIISNLMKAMTIRIWKSNVEAFNLRSFAPKPLI